MVRRAGPPAVVGDEEFLPFAPASFDLVLSCLSLHWVNDLPGSLLQIRHALKPGGLFLGALFGAGSLMELRAAFRRAEQDGAPRISPFADIRDAGALLQRAGFALPVADRDMLGVSYGDPFALMRDLRGMGEANALSARRRNFTSRALMRAVAAHYGEMHGDEDGRIPASFEILQLTGWAPDE
jgi:SAM-dependent methyltransferase